MQDSDSSEMSEKNIFYEEARTEEPFALMYENATNNARNTGKTRLLN